MKDLDYSPVMISGKKYVPIDVVISGTSNTDSTEESLKEIGGFVQQVKEIKMGWLSVTYIIVVCMVPEDKVIEFSQKQA